jgi:hypothetical protein
MDFTKTAYIISLLALIFLPQALNVYLNYRENEGAEGYDCR